MTTTERGRDRTLIDWQEYEHFAGYNWSLDDIAARLGVEPESLRTGLARRAARDRAHDTGAGVAA